MSLKLIHNFLTHNVGPCRQALRSYSAAAYTTRYADYESIQVTAPQDHILHVELNRPERRNAIDRDMFREIKHCFSEIENDKQCRAVVISGTGKMFSAGVDLQDMMEMMTSYMTPMMEAGACHPRRDDVAGRAKYIRHLVQSLQNCFSSIRKCQKPVIAAVHSGCIGAGLDLISAADVRYSTNDAYFSLREIALGMAADLGSLQRLPQIMGSDSLVRELAFTGRDLSASEAKECGLVSKTFPNIEECVEGAIDLAQCIASRSPVAVQGTKVSLNYSRDHPNERDGLEFMQVWNMAMLQSEDFVMASASVANKKKDPKLNDEPEFADL